MRCSIQCWSICTRAASWTWRRTCLSQTSHCCAPPSMPAACRSTVRRCTWWRPARPGGSTSACVCLDLTAVHSRPDRNARHALIVCTIVPSSSSVSYVQGDLCVSEGVPPRRAAIGGAGRSVPAQPAGGARVSVRRVTAVRRHQCLQPGAQQ